MTKLESVTARLGLDSVKYIEKVNKLFGIDRSTAFRKILQKGIEQDKKEKAIELYLKGGFSLEQASRFSGLYIGEFLDYMGQKGIEKNITLDDFKETLKYAKNL
jgi:predicted HTH domain antitoxin